MHLSYFKTSGLFGFFKLLSVVGVCLISGGLCAAGNATIPTTESVEILKDVAYLDAARTEKMDLYLPMPASSRRGAVVWIHGGGWAGGKKDDHRERMVSNTLAKAGFVVASIDYVLSQKEAASWPNALFDCKEAVRFLRANAKKYNINPRHIAVAGGSAGAHLALMTAYTAGKNGYEPTDSPYPNISSEVAAVVELYGITNLLTWQRTDKDGTPTGKPKHPSSSLRFTGKNLPEGADVWRDASPVSHVNAEVPPTFITHGKRDTEVDYLQALELAKALEENGVSHELVMLENTGHTYSLTHMGKQPLEKDLSQPVVVFLEAAFAQADKAQ